MLCQVLIKFYSLLHLVMDSSIDTAFNIFTVFYNMPLKKHLTSTLFIFEFIINFMLLEVFPGAIYFSTEVASPCN